MKVASVVVSYNSAKDLPECLTSIQGLALSDLRLAIYVVDNASSDNSAQVVKRFKMAKLIQNSKNLGFSGGNNVGIKTALKDGVDAILLLNPDTKADKGLILELVKALRSDPKSAVVSPKIYFYPGFEFHKDRYSQDDLGKVIWYAGGKIDWSNVLASHRGVDEVDNGQYDRMGETDFATGAAMMIKKQVFDEIGFFDEKFFLYLEDLDFCLRAAKAGFKIFYAPAAVIWHKWARSAGGGSRLQDYYFTRNRLLFGLKYAAARAKLALFRQSLQFLFGKNTSKRQAVLDFYLGKFGRGSLNR